MDTLHSAPAAHPSRLHAKDLTLGYDKRVISSQLNVEIPDDSFTVIVGPNACGKSTLLRALSRLLRPAAGAVVLDGRAIHERKAKAFAREVGLLPQSSLSPDGIVVADLVSRGRYPHQGIVRQWSSDDARCQRGARSDPHDRALNAACGRALRRPAAASVGRDGVGPGDPDPAP